MCDVAFQATDEPNVPLRILHISTRLILGGSQENTVLSCEGQARLGHRVHLAFGPIFGPEGSLLERVERFNHRCRSGEERTEDGGAVCPIVTHTVPHMVRELSARADFKCYGELRELIRRLTPDVVHTHSSKAGIIGRCAAWKVKDRRPRVVHTIHGPPFMPVEGESVRRLKTRFINRVYTVAERYAAKRCDVIVSVADAMTRAFLARGIGRAAQYVTVYSGMETGTFLEPLTGETRAGTRAEMGIGPDEFVVGTVARLAEHKGHDDLLDALGADLKANPDWKLLWVGDGWWRERLAAKARGMGLGVYEADKGGDAAGASIVLTGLVPPQEVAPLVRSMDVLAHPSYREGLPRTVPQALLCGVCPVAYDVDGTGEVCRDMETGRLVRAGDVAGLREAVVWCEENAVARRALAMRGRGECEEMFSAERMVEALERVYSGR